MVGTGGEQDSLSLLYVKVLIKMFKLIPGMAIFRSCPLMTPLRAGVRTGGE